MKSKIQKSIVLYRKQAYQGFIALEALIAIVSIVFILFLFVYMFISASIKTALQSEVHLLAQKIRLNGGIDVHTDASFRNQIKAKGIDSNGIAIRVIELETNKNLYGITGSHYSKRSDGNTIRLQVAIPKKMPTSAFNPKNKYYYFEEFVMSEKW